MIFGKGSNKDSGKMPEKQSGPQGRLKQSLGKISGRKIAAYTMLPGIFPRLRELAAKFGHFAYILALVYRAVQLLPYNHPYLNAANIGRFGIRDVVGAASGNLVLKRENADQIAVFVAIGLSLILVACQVAMTIFLFATKEVQAASFFETPDMNKDVVMIFLGHVFGPDLGIFATATRDGSTLILGTPVHNGLYAMLSFYSQAMMVLAVFIVVYYIITVVGEAAISGTPFGRRFNSLWAPIRLIVALGLLVPLPSGLNSAQYITLYTAKLGSGMATQAWIKFSETTSNPTNVFIEADAPSLAALVQGIFMSEVCAAASDQLSGTTSVSISEIMGSGNNTFRNNFARSSGGFTDAATLLQTAAQGWQVPRSAPPRRQPYQSVYYTWTTEPNSRNYAGMCGYVKFDFSNDKYRMADGEETTLVEIDTIKRAYINSVRTIQQQMMPIAQRVAQHYIDLNNGVPPASRTDISSLGADLQGVLNTAQQQVSAEISAAATAAAASAAPNIFADMTDRGWGGAGLWYMRIGQINQQISDAARNAPTAQAMTESENGGPGWWSRFFDNIASTFGSGAYLSEISEVMSRSAATFESEVADDPNFFTEGYFNGVANMFAENAFTMDNFIQYIFGVRSLYDFAQGGAGNLDPMVGLMQAGNNMLMRTRDFFAAILIASAGAGLIESIPFVGGMIGAVLTVLTPFLFMFTFVGFTVGMLLFYFLPMMPFVYFFFAVVTWVGEIFEAIVAMPLWALAHLKIDGDGLPGPLATNGYFLLLGIFIRPILIVFGMIGGMMIFAAGAFFLTSVFDTMVSNIHRGVQLSAISNFVYVVLFGWMCYQLGTISFKMIDTVPANILRWIGQGGATPYSDGKGDVIGDGSRLMMASGFFIQPATQAMGGLRSASSALGQKARGAMGGAAGAAGGSGGAKQSGD